MSSRLCVMPQVMSGLVGVRQDAYPVPLYFMLIEGVYAGEKLFQLYRYKQIHEGQRFQDFYLLLMKGAILSPLWLISNTDKLMGTPSFQNQSGLGNRIS